MPAMKGHRIFPHGKLEEIAPAIWQVQGSLPVPLPRNMTVHRLPGGDLVIYSAVALDDEGMAELEALGRPAWLVVPHPLHTMDAPFYKARYPGIRVIAPEDAASRLRGVKVDIDPRHGLADLGLRHHIAPGMRYTEVVLELPVEAGRALLFTDLVARGDAPSFLHRLLGPPGAMGLPRLVKYRQVRDRPQMRRFFEELADGDDLRLVLCSHGPPIESECATGLRVAAARI
jgi:hypothetical protein